LKVAVISPHFDDACFSLGGSLLTWTRQRHNIDIFDCFTVSNFVADGGDRDPAQVSRRRRLEEESFVQQLGSNASYFGLGEKDAPLRLSCPLNDVFGRSAADDPEALARLRSALRITDTYDVIVIPLAAGRHIDHELAKAVAIDEAQDRCVAFYEDLPYSAQLADHDIAELATAAGHQAKKSLLPLAVGRGVSWEEKARLVRLYKSQVTAEVEAAIRSQYERYGGGERLWVDAGFRKLMAASFGKR
jgi:LmbE family N-acetylglucosaminyl deacetylase